MNPACKLQFVAHFVSFGLHQSADKQDRVGLIVLDQEKERVVDVEEFGVPDFVAAVEVGVEGVAFRVQFQGGRVEDVGEIQVLLAGDLGQVSFVLIHGFG